MDDPKKKRFVWGVLLAWAPWVPTIIGLGYAFRDIWETKATGITAVRGGLVELFVVWGIGAMIIGQATAIVLLVRAFSREHWTRSLFSVVSICLSGLTLLIVSLFLWLSWYENHHTYPSAPTRFESVLGRGCYTVMA